MQIVFSVGSEFLINVDDIKLKHGLNKFIQEQLQTQTMCKETQGEWNKERARETERERERGGGTRKINRSAITNLKSKRKHRTHEKKI